METTARADMPDTERTMGKAMKRRGILAAAGAVVAGIVAKQTSQPVAAGTDGDVVLGSISNAATAETGVLNSGPSSPGGPAIHGFRSPGAVTVVATTVNAGVVGQTFVTDAPGVEGRSPSGSQAKGVHGISGSGYGVFGEGMTGVHGESTSSIGVEGECDASGGIGVVGASVAGVGIKGAATTGFPVIGQVTGPTTANAGVLGVSIAGPGVQGQSTGGHGLVGTTSATDGVHTALIGVVQPGSNAIALRGSVSAGAVGYAGIFDGDVLVNGALRVFGSPKNAAVKHADGTYRLLYCVESPESWFEDVGKATVTNGAVDVKLDPDFAALVHADDYHVFLTAYGNTNGLYVTGQTPSGFTVREYNGGVGNLTISWRVMAKRKDIVGERLAQVAPPPPSKPVTPFTVPETPLAKPPPTKP